MRERERDDSNDVGIGVKHGVASSLSSSSVYVISKRALRHLKVSRTLLPPFKGEHLQVVDNLACTYHSDFDIGVNIYGFASSSRRSKSI